MVQYTLRSHEHQMASVEVALERVRRRLRDQPRTAQGPGRGRPAQQHDRREQAADSGGGLAAIPYRVDFPGASALATGTLLSNIIRRNTAIGMTASGDILLFSQGDNAAVEIDLITNNIGKVANLGRR